MIILGDKKKFLTQIQIRGSIDKPEFNNTGYNHIFKILLNILELLIIILK